MRGQVELDIPSRASGHHSAKERQYQVYGVLGIFAIRVFLRCFAACSAVLMLKWDTAPTIIYRLNYLLKMSCHGNDSETSVEE